MHHFRDFGHTDYVVNEVLPDFDSNMRQAVFLGVVINCKVLGRLACIRLVITDLVSGVALALQENLAGLLVFVPKHTHLPSARFTVEDGRKTVDRNKCRRRARLGEALYLLVHRTMIGPVKGARAQVLVGLPQVTVPWHQNAVAVLEKGTRIHELAIAVDNQARVIVYNRCNAQALCETLGDRTGPDVDGKMAAPGKWIETHVAQRFWKAVAGVVADQQNWQLGQGVEYPERPRFVGR